jgi:hypothetical protein
MGYVARMKDKNFGQKTNQKIRDPVHEILDKVRLRAQRYDAKKKHRGIQPGVSTPHNWK